MAARIAIQVSNADLAAVDKAVEAGRYATREDALREGLIEVLRRERSQDVAIAYEKAYRAHPENERYGQVGLGLMVERVSDDRSS